MRAQGAKFFLCCIFGGCKPHSAQLGWGWEELGALQLPGLGFGALSHIKNVQKYQQGKGWGCPFGLVINAALKGL